MTFKPRTRTRARRLGGLLAGTLALGLVPLASPASAADPLPQQQNIRDPFDTSSCPAEPPTGTITRTDVPEDGFTDVPANNVHEFAIDCVAWYDITSGKTATTYAPAGSVRRDQMATFIAQMIDYVAERTATPTGQQPDGLPNVPSGNRFPCDVNVSNVHFDNIQRLAAANVIRGSGESNSAGACFDPDGTVTRGQMATFLREASRVAGVPLALTDEDFFVDDENSIHEPNINAIGKAGIAAGAGRDQNNENIYRPDEIVRRDQMGSFIATTLDLLVEKRDVDQPPTVVVTFAPATNVEKGDDLVVTVSGERGEIASATASGCGAPAETATGNATVAGDDVVITLDIPADQATGECDITVETDFVDVNAFGGQDRSRTDVFEITVIPATTPAT